MTDWEVVRASLMRRGVWDGMNNIGRKARMRNCRKCGRPVMTGLDDPDAAATAICDPTPLSAFGEAAARILNRHTYALHWRGSRYELDYRGSHEIARAPAGSDPGFEVLGQHVCNQPLPEGCHGRVTVGPSVAFNPEGDTDEPPF